MKTLNAARRAVGLSAQGINCSITVVNNTLKQLEREVGAGKLPHTEHALQTMLANNGLVAEKVALLSMDEINAMREDIRPRPKPLSDEEVDAEQQDPDLGEQPQRPH